MSLSIVNRILIGFGVTLILTLLLGLYALDRIAEVRDSASIIVDRDIRIIRHLSDIRNNQADLRELRDTAVRRFLVTTLNRPQNATDDPIAQWRRQSAEMERSVTEAIATAAGFRAMALNVQRQDTFRLIEQRLTQVQGELKQQQAESERQLAAVAANDLERALASEAPLNTSRTNIDRLLDAAEEAVSSSLKLGQTRVSGIYDESRNSLAVGVGLVALVGLLVTYTVRRSILSQLRNFTEFVDRVGRGDLSGAAAATGTDELGRLGVTLNQMVEGLRQLARQSREATEDLNASAAEIRASTQEQAASVEEQLAAVQETAATVDEITHAGSQIGKRAQEVIAAAQATAQTSASGLQAVEETSRAMDAIREQAQAVAENIVALSEKTQAIGEIITTVNDVSERSHLLALNAAIEAAAAGESGRSFSVVAAEMKLLADQAKEATNQVRSILGDIQRGINASVMLTEEAVKRVAMGKERSDVTQRTIDEITARVQESVQTFQQIVASTNQQQLGIEQVMSALQNIRQASQQTAAGTRQLDQAASNLSTLSHQLLSLAERYRI